MAQGIREQRAHHGVALAHHPVFGKASLGVESGLRRAVRQRHHKASDHEGEQHLDEGEGASHHEALVRRRRVNVVPRGEVTVTTISCTRPRQGRTSTRRRKPPCAPPSLP